MTAQAVRKSGLGDSQGDAACQRAQVDVPGVQCGQYKVCLKNSVVNHSHLCNEKTKIKQFKYPSSQALRERDRTNPAGGSDGSMF